LGAQIKPQFPGTFRRTWAQVWASQVALVVKNPPANAGDIGSVSRWRRGSRPTPGVVFLPGDSCGQRSLAGYSP